MLRWLPLPITTVSRNVASYSPRIYIYILYIKTRPPRIPRCDEPNFLFIFFFCIHTNAYALLKYTLNTIILDSERCDDCVWSRNDVFLFLSVHNYSTGKSVPIFLRANTVFRYPMVSSRYAGERGRFSIFSTLRSASEKKYRKVT